MAKSSENDGYLIALCPALAIFLGFGIAALSLLKSAVTVWIFTLPQFLGIISAVGLIAYILAIILVAARKADVKRHLILSFEALFASIVLVVFSPIALILWAIESICDGVTKKHCEKQR